MTKKNNFLELENKAHKIRGMVISMIVKAHASHIGSSYSIVEILVYLYEKVISINPKRPDDPDRDRFILSKGWGVSTLYAVTCRKRIF